MLETRSPIRDMLVLDDRLLVLTAFGVQRVAAEGPAETVAAITRETHSQLGDPLTLASVDGRELWVAGALGVARHSGGWQLTPVDADDRPLSLRRPDRRPLGSRPAQGPHHASRNERRRRPGHDQPD